MSLDTDIISYSIVLGIKHPLNLSYLHPDHKQDEIKTQMMSVERAAAAVYVWRVVVTATINCDALMLRV